MADVPALSWRGQARWTVPPDAGQGLRDVVDSAQLRVCKCADSLLGPYLPTPPNPFPRSEATAAQFMHQDGES